MDKNEMIAYFDRCAPQWDNENLVDPAIVEAILDNAQVGEGQDVLDVACGTGVLMPDYLSRRAASVTGIDISPEMIKIAEQKFSQDNIRFVCGDVETADVGSAFDAIVIYNAFPHFPDQERLIAHLATLLAPDGILTVAHGASRETIDAHHHGFASKVSVGLMPAEELADMFAKYLEVTTVISNEKMYQVAGKRR